MRVREARIAFGILMALIVLSCSKRAIVPTRTSSELDSGNCAGCLLKAQENLFSFVVRTDADYDSLMTHCFLERIREEWLPPSPGIGEELVYVSLIGGGCGGCLDIVGLREKSQNIVVDVEGGIRGECDMLLVLGAWALVPETDKPITVEFHDVVCTDDR